MHRKEFIKICCVAGLGGSALSIFLQSCSTSNYFAHSTFSNNRITIQKSEFIISKNNKSTDRKYILIKSEQLKYPICIFKISNENYSALLMECTHKSCELNPQDNYLVCPCHGSEFTNTGSVQNPPAEINLKSFKTTTDNDNIYVQL